jgi:hypothetical protein
LVAELGCGVVRIAVFLFVVAIDGAPGRAWLC